MGEVVGEALQLCIVIVVLVFTCWQRLKAKDSGVGVHAVDKVDGDGYFQMFTWICRVNILRGEFLRL